MTLPRFVSLVLIVVTSGLTSAYAQPAAYEVIARLGLEESDLAARDMPGW
ncbi:MAG: hypothetical protein HN793_03645, partial [Rhodospirillaceae bacterium]|nr:hypothetical protein [Rhodospirillaceae bacterium]